MLSAKIIRKWQKLCGPRPIDEHGIANLASQDAEAAEAWEHSAMIDDLIGSAKIVKNGRASQFFISKLNERLAEETDGPEAIKAIWDAV